MLGFYVDISVLQNTEMQNTILINMIFSKLHGALVKISNNDIGVSFPKVGKTLGSVLRLHGSEASLKKLLSEEWIEHLYDYAKLSEICPVPVVRKYRQVCRIQVKSNPERLLRRSIKKGWLAEDNLSEKLNKLHAKNSNLPFVDIRSSSTGQKYKLFIKHSEIMDQPQQGSFSLYGLSADATIPWF